MTAQLARIHAVLLASDDHPTAALVLERVRASLPRISLATVYRNLEKLEGQGRLRVVRGNNGRAHFDATLEPHDHFVCESCSAIADLPAGHSSSAIDVPRGCVARWRTTSVFGLCAACRSGATDAVHPAPRRGARAR